MSSALRSGDPLTLLAASVTTTALIAAEPDAMSQARYAIIMLEALLLDPTWALPAVVRERLERAVDDFVSGPATTAGERLTALWRDVADVLAQEGFAPARADLVAQVEEYLAAHPGERVGLVELARVLGYSTSHVSTAVRRLTGRRFTALRRDVQLDRATRLLRRGTSVKEAALGAGFCDPAYFSRVFRRTFGVPPGRWRDAAQRERHVALSENSSVQPNLVTTTEEERTKSSSHPGHNGGFRALHGGSAPPGRRSGPVRGGCGAVRVLLFPRGGRGRGLSCDSKIETD